MQFPFKIDDEWLGCYLAKGDCKPFWGLSSAALGGMCTHVGAGNAVEKVLCVHEVGEQDLQRVSLVSGCPKRRSRLPCPRLPWQFGCRGVCGMLFASIVVTAVEKRGEGL